MLDPKQELNIGKIKMINFEIIKRKNKNKFK